MRVTVPYVLFHYKMVTELVPYSVNTPFTLTVLNCGFDEKIPVRFVKHPMLQHYFRTTTPQSNFIPHRNKEIRLNQI